LDELEATYSALQELAFPYRTRIETATHLAVFDGMIDLEPLGHRATAGLFLYDGSGTVNLAPLALLPGRLVESEREVVVHELCHRFITFYYPQAPHWLNEGLAEYYSTLALEPGQVAFGGYLRGITFSAEGRGIGVSSGDAYLVIPTSSVPTLEALRKLDSSGFYALERDAPDSRAASDQRATNYSSSWAAVHTLKSLPAGPGRFERYLESLHEAAVDEPTAWQKAFGDIPETTLEGAFRRFLTAHETDVVRHPFERPEHAQARVRAMSAVEVLVLSARARNSRDPAASIQAAAELDRAVGLDAQGAEARRLRGVRRLLRGDVSGAEQDLRQAFAVGSGAPAYTHALALLLVFKRESAPNPERLDDEYVRLMTKLVRTATTSTELDFVARYLLAKKNLGSALHFALRGLKADAACYRCFETLASIAEQRGDLAAAVRAQATAVNLVPHGLEDPALVARLEEYRERRRGEERREGAP
jgi:hypothetical protein